MSSLSCFLSFIYWNPVQRKYLPLPNGVTVEAMDADPISADDVLGSAPLIGGKAQLDCGDDGEAPDLYFRLLIGDRAIDLLQSEWVTIEPPYDRPLLRLPKEWDSKNKFAVDQTPGLLDDFEKKRLGDPERPLVFSVTFDCFFRLVYWNELRGEYTGIPQGIEVEVVEDHFLGDRVLGIGRTDDRGRVQIRLADDHDERPSLYFRYEMPPNKLGYVRLSDNVLVDEHADDTILLPRTWSSKEAFSRFSLTKKGYFEEYRGIRVGKWGSPYTFDVLSGAPVFQRGAKVRPLINGSEIEPALFASIEAAQESIHAQVMLYFNDTAGHRLKDLLIRKAKEGVEVRLLFDVATTTNAAALVTMKKLWNTFFRSEVMETTAADAEEEAEKRRGDTSSLRAELSGVPNLSFVDSSFPYVQLKPAAPASAPEAYKKLEENLPFFTVARIDHRKLFVIDGKTAFLGGANVGDEYLYLDPYDASQPAESEPFPRWHDCFVQVSGPPVQRLQRLFRERWVAEGGDAFDLPRGEESRSPRHPYFPKLDPDSDGLPICILDTTPGARHQVHTFYMSLIRGAKKEIWLQNPYFSLREVLRELVEAARRGVKVTCIFPGHRNDSYDFLYAARLKYADLIDAGAGVYEYQNHMTHAKVAVIDDYTVIGSANLNHASFFNHYEVSAVVRDRALARNFRRRLFDEDLKHSIKIRREDLPELLDINLLARAWIRGVVDEWF